MKILITSDWYYPIVNGVVRSILNLKGYLESQGHDVRVLTLSNSTDSYYLDSVYYIGSVGAGKIYPDARVTATLRNKLVLELIDWKPDVIHSQCEFSTFFIARKIANKTDAPIVHTYHTVYEDYTKYFSPSERVGKKVIGVFSRAIAEKVDTVVVPSKKTEDILLGYGVDEEKIKIIPTGIEIDDLQDKNALREKYGYGKDDKIMLYLGRLAYEKKIEELIDYFEKIDYENLRFLIVGGGPYLKKLKEYAKDNNKEIDFVGMVDPSCVKDYYQLSDIFASASQSETQGLTYFEALSNGVIALCRKDTCLEKVIIDDFNGYQYETYDEFEDKLIEYLDHEDERNEMQKNARKYAVENFSIESFGKKCEKEYERLINKVNVNENIDLF